ncbi:hypothetical protein HR060_05320 [Catenovulum sp. SM1970]|uniref:hypothetical protein n=1 Tax=Marinifaba aquimaris TaxID=2741323 RepID=UPI0015744830|nr:hypothetical protein [Marinifaba aquimaris]NTS76283.1 hypothetical protein [Marinifaba aquimaris]
MDLTAEQQLNLLEKEYFHLNQVVESFDAKSLTIKAWNVTLAGTLGGAGAFTKHYELLLFASLASLLFWYIDTYWKNFQYANYRRIKQIEEYMAGELPDITVFQMCHTWNQSYNNQPRSRFYRIMFWPHVVLPHGLTFLGMLLCYIVLSSH